MDGSVVLRVSGLSPLHPETCPFHSPNTFLLFVSNSFISFVFLLFLWLVFLLTTFTSTHLSFLISKYGRLFTSTLCPAPGTMTTSNGPPRPSFNNADHPETRDQLLEHDATLIVSNSVSLTVGGDSLLIVGRSQCAIPSLESFYQISVLTKHRHSRR